MHTLIELLLREGAFFVLLLMLGAGPASFLSARFNAGTRWALAPVLGFCAGSCVTTTVLQFAPANDTDWLLVPLALASALVAAWRSRRRRAGLPRLSDVAQIALVCVVVGGPLTYNLADQHTVGPTAYYFTDVDGYVAEIDGAITTSAHDAGAAWIKAEHGGTRFSDLTQYNWAFRASYNQNLDAAPLEANLAALIGQGATGIFSPFLIVLLVSGALGVLAGVRYLTQSSTWAAALPAALFGGPFFLELYYDSFQAAICGLGLIVPLIVVTSEVFRGGRKADVALSALVVSGFLTVYPLFVPLVVATAALVLAWSGFRRRRAGEPVRPYVLPIVGRLAAAGVLACALEPVAFVRDIHYAISIINNTLPLPRVGFKLPLDVLPGWLLQTREFWDMPPLSVGGAKQILLGAVIPLAFIGLIVVALRRNRSTVVLIVLAAVCALVAEYSFTSRQACTYCAERNLLPLAPIGAVLIGVGIFALLSSGDRKRMAVALLGAGLVIVAVGQRTRVELQRFRHLSYFVDTANRDLLAKLPGQAGALQLEGYNSSLAAQAEEPLTYFAANERRPGQVSIVTADTLNPGLSYLTFGNPTFPAVGFFTNYRYVLTRFGGIHTNRHVLARSGGLALEERAGPLDVIPIQGLAVPLARLDPSGTAWVQIQPPLVFYVVGTASTPRVWASLTFRTKVPVTVPAQPGVRAKQRGDVLTVCSLAAGSSPLRTVRLTLSAAPAPGPTPKEAYPPPVPLEGIALTGIHPVTGTCTP